MKPIISIAIAIYVPGYAGAFLSGFYGSKGDLKAGLISAATAGMFKGVGSLGGAPGSLQKIALHGLVGGVSSSLQGGSFKSGFMSAAIAQAFAPGIDNLDRGNAGISVTRTIAAALVGGTVAELGGGKFANGAVTGAFSRMFNDDSYHQNKLLGEVNGMGSSKTFDAGNTIKIEPYSHTVGADPFTYAVDYHYYDNNSKLVPMASPLNEFGKPIPAFVGHAVTGQGGGGPDRTFTAPALKVDGSSARIQWRVTIPHQIETHQNTMGWNLRVYKGP